jgi:hypothetical protein
MTWGRSIAITFLAVLACCSPINAQSRGVAGSAIPNHPGSTQGQLTVTITIVPSVGVVVGADGQPKVVCANCTDPRDNTSSLAPSPPKSNNIGQTGKAQAKQK